MSAASSKPLKLERLVDISTSGGTHISRPDPPWDFLSQRSSKLNGFETNGIQNQLNLRRS